MSISIIAISTAGMFGGCKAACTGEIDTLESVDGAPAAMPAGKPRDTSLRISRDDGNCWPSVSNAG